MNIHPALLIHRLQNPNAEVRLNGKSLFWVDGVRENSITFFEDAELPEMKRMSFGMDREVVFEGNIRFSSTHN